MGATSKEQSPIVRATEPPHPGPPCRGATHLHTSLVQLGQTSPLGGDAAQSYPVRWLCEKQKALLPLNRCCPAPGWAWLGFAEHTHSGSSVSPGCWNTSQKSPVVSSQQRFASIHLAAPCQPPTGRMEKATCLLALSVKRHISLPLTFQRHEPVTGRPEATGAGVGKYD